MWITEYNTVPMITPGQVSPIAVEPAVTDQTVTYTTATSSTAFNTNTNFVRLYASADCHVLFGASPTATASKQKLAGGTEYWRSVIAGQKVSVYDGSS